MNLLPHPRVEPTGRGAVSAPAPMAVAERDRGGRGLQTVLMLGGILVVGLFFRLWALDAVGFNSDEAVYAGQAASLAQRTEFQPFFPIFRAHPLLFQTAVSLVYMVELTDFIGRVVSVCFGVATIVVVYALGRLLYGRRVGLIAALLLAVMPYHVVVTRQVLLDGPMAFFATLALYCTAKYATTLRPLWLYLAAWMLGLTFLSNERSILLVGSLYAFFALAQEIRVRLRDLVLAGVLFVGTISVFPVALFLSGRESTGESFLAWQLFRRPNHSWTFYFTEVPPALGWLVLVSALAGLWFLRSDRSWRETLLVTHAAVPVVFFELWPVKGFQYLLPVAVPLVVLAARALCRLGDLRTAVERERRGRWIAVGAVGVVALSLAVPSWQRITPSTAPTFLAGSGGVPGGREAGRWVAENVPEGAQLMTIGPSMANILQFYGHRRALGLSVSPNPLHRNPVYEPIINPDSQIRDNELQYLVWDSFSASRSEHFERVMLRYVERYHGRLVHTETVRVRTADGASVEQPVIKIFEVRP